MISCTHSPPNPPSPTATSGLSSAHARRCYRSAISACSAAARPFSPLCFTDSGFNSDSAQYTADGAAPEQVSASNYSSPLPAPSRVGQPPAHGPGSCPPPPRFSPVSPRSVLRGMLCVLCYVSVCWCMAAPGPAVAHRGWEVFLRGNVHGTGGFNANRDVRG